MRERARSAVGARTTHFPEQRTLLVALVLYSRDQRNLALIVWAVVSRGGEVHARPQAWSIVPQVEPRLLFSYLGLGDGVGGLDWALHHAALILDRLVRRHGAYAYLDHHGGWPGQRRGKDALRQ